MNLQPVPELQHRTVLLEEAVDALAIAGERANGIYLDGTFGRGGHSRAILSRLGPQGRLIAFDKDPLASPRRRRLTMPGSRSCTTASRPWMKRLPHAALRRSTAY